MPIFNFTSNRVQISFAGQLLLMEIRRAVLGSTWYIVNLYLKVS